MKRSIMNNLSSAMAALRHSCTFAIFLFSVSRERTRWSKMSGDWSSTRKNRQALEVSKIWLIDWQADEPTEWLAKNWTSRLINLSIDWPTYLLIERMRIDSLIPWITRLLCACHSVRSFMEAECTVFACTFSFPISIHVMLSREFSFSRFRSYVYICASIWLFARVASRGVKWQKKTERPKRSTVCQFN